MATAKRSKATASTRLSALEERVEALEKELAALRPARKNEASSSSPPKRTGPRCPGCSLPVESVASGTCPWCGFVFDAVPAARRRKL